MFNGPYTLSSSIVMYDIAIKGWKVLDGAGNPWMRASIATEGGEYTGRPAGRVLRLN